MGKDAEDNALIESFEIPQHLKYWINSIPRESCILLKDSKDLLSGHVFEDIVKQLLEVENLPTSVEIDDSSSRIFNTLEQLAAVVGWDNMPKQLDPDSIITVAMAIAEGNSRISIFVLEFLKYLHSLAVDGEGIEQETTQNGFTRDEPLPKPARELDASEFIEAPSHAPLDNSLRTSVPVVRTRKTTDDHASSSRQPELASRNISTSSSTYQQNEGKRHQIGSSRLDSDSSGRYQQSEKISQHQEPSSPTSVQNQRNRAANPRSTRDSNFHTLYDAQAERSRGLIAQSEPEFFDIVDAARRTTKKDALRNSIRSEDPFDNSKRDKRGPSNNSRSRTTEIAVDKKAADLTVVSRSKRSSSVKVDRDRRRSHHEEPTLTLVCPPSEFDENRKMLLALWLRDTLHISTAARISVLMPSVLMQNSKFGNETLFAIVQVRVGHDGLQSGESYRLRVTPSSAIDLDLMNYLAAVQRYDPNSDPGNVGRCPVPLAHYHNLPACDWETISRLQHAVMLQIGLENEWRNGVFLSELLANTLVKGKSKDIVKQADVSLSSSVTGDKHNSASLVRSSMQSMQSFASSITGGTPMQRMVLAATDVVVKNKAQAIRNINNCLQVLRKEALMATESSDVTADNILFGSVDYIWKVIWDIYCSCSGSRDILGKVQKLVRKRSISAPPRISNSVSLGGNLAQRHMSRHKSPPANSYESVSRMDSHFSSSFSALATRARDKSPHRGTVESTAQSMSSPSPAPISLRPHPVGSRNTDTNRGRSRSMDRDLTLKSKDHHPSSSSSVRNQANVEKSVRWYDNSSQSRQLVRNSSFQKALLSPDLPMPLAREDNRPDRTRFDDIRRVEQLKSRAMARKYRLRKFNRETSSGDNELDVRPAWESSTAVTRQNGVRNSQADEYVEDKGKVRTNNLSRSPPRRSINSSDRALGNWIAPSVDPLYARGLLSAQPVPVVTMPQQRAVREWLLSLGLVVRDGEGGFFCHEYSPHIEVVSKHNHSAAYTNATMNHHHHTSGVTGLGSTNAPYYGASTTVTGTGNGVGSGPSCRAADPLPLSQDRMRNGELLCDLLALLEPTAASHANISSLIVRNPGTLRQATENIERAQWLFRLRRSPPIPPQYLCQTESILKGVKDVLWGLLWEIMQAYPLSIETPQSSDEIQNSLQTNIIGTDNSVPTLQYSRAQRRQLDVTLVRWLKTLGVLDLFVGGLATPTTILALEGPLRDGTLMCLVLEFGFRVTIRSINKAPHTFSQCVGNVSKCLHEFNRLTGMNQRFTVSKTALKAAVEGFVRGDWNVILGVLEDVYRCYCSQQNLVPSFMGRVAASIDIPRNSEGPGLQKFDLLPCKSVGIDGSLVEVGPNQQPKLGFGQFVSPEWRVNSEFWSGNATTQLDSYSSSAGFNPKLRIDQGVDGSKEMDRYSSGSHVSTLPDGQNLFMATPSIEPSYSTAQVLGDVLSVAANSKRTIDELPSIVSVNSNSIPSQLAPSTTDPAFMQKTNVDIFPARNSTVIANELNKENSLYSIERNYFGNQTGRHRYSVHDMTSLDPAFPIQQSVKAIHGETARVAINVQRSESPSTEVLRKIDQVLAETQSWRSSPLKSPTSTNLQMHPTDIAPDPQSVPGGLNLRDTNYSRLNLVPHQDRQITARATAVQSLQRETKRYAKDFGSGQGESIIPVPSTQANENYGTRSGPSSKPLQSVTREREEIESLHQSKTVNPGNKLRLVSSPTRGPSPVKLRQQIVHAHGVASHHVDPSDERSSRKITAFDSAPSWLQSTEDPVPAGIGVGVPEWVLQATKSTTPSKTAQPVDKTPIVGSNGKLYDEAMSVATGSPQSIADDSLLDSERTLQNHQHKKSSSLSSKGVRGNNVTGAGQKRALQGLPSKSAGRASAETLSNELQARAVSSIGDILAEKRVRDAERIGQWLERLGIRFDDKETFISGYALNAPLQEFRNGVLLGQLVCKLERLVEIPGFVPTPKTPAQGLQNIRRALEILRKNNKIPVLYLSQPEAIFEGDGAVLLDLLNVLRKVYAHIII